MKAANFLVLALLLASRQAAVAGALSDPELDQIHAGFMTTTGLSVSLGANMKSYVDGSLVLESTMTLNTAGTLTSQSVGANGAPLTSAGVVNIPTSLAGATATVPGPGGSTTFLHSLSNEGLTNMVVNTANGQQIVQNTSLTIAIPHLDILQQQLALAGLATRLHDVVGGGLLNAAGH